MPFVLADPPREGDGSASQPWDRREGETPKAYAAFCVYLGLAPADRSIDAAYALHRERLGRPLEKPQRAPSHWGRWSARHDWVARAEAHDQHALQSAIAKRSELRERAHQHAIDHAEELIRRLVDVALGRAGKVGMVQLMALKHALKLAGVIAPKKIEVSSTGRQADHAAEIEAGLSRLSLDELRALAAGAGVADE